MNGSGTPGSRDPRSGFGIYVVVNPCSSPLKCQREGVKKTHMEMLLCPLEVISMICFCLRFVCKQGCLGVNDRKVNLQCLVLKLGTHATGIDTDSLEDATSRVVLHSSTIA